MDDLIPINLGELFHDALLQGRRENDHLLHASSHILGSERHAALDVAGAPRKVNPLMSEITLMTGTMWHDWFANTLRKAGVPFMAEVNLTPWLPEGWAGTADAFIWNPEVGAFLLVDFKTIRGSGLSFIRRDGAKAEHVAQASAYWYAAKAAGFPLIKKVAVLYWPKDDARGELTEPLMVDFEPLPKAKLHKAMASRWTTVSRYVTSLGGVPGAAIPKADVRPLAGWVTSELPDEQPRVQKLKRDKALGTADLLLVPHWSAAYCPYPDELCACSTQGTTKIGTFDTDGEYYPRGGYEKIVPTVTP